MNLNFINGKVYDPRRNCLEQINVAVAAGKILGLGYLPDEKDNDYEVIDIADKIIVPNITDGFVCNTLDSLRKLNDIAIKAGVTGLGLYAEPLLKMNSPEDIAYIKRKTDEIGGVSFYPFGAISNGSLNELDLMSDAGAVGFIDTKSVECPNLMRNFLLYSQVTGKRLIIRSLDEALMNDGVMNEGYYSTLLGLKPSPGIAEEIRIARDIQLCETYGGKLHFNTITTSKSVDLIRQAKAKGIDVTCATSIHYLYYTDENCDGFDTNFKVFPPLRTKVDQAALITGLKDGSIDMVTSHHKPLTLDEKREDFQNAKPGISSLDLFLPLLLNKLHHEHKLPLEHVFDLVTKRVHDVFQVKPKGISISNIPNFTVIDPAGSLEVSESMIHSEGKNTPYIGLSLKGHPVMTVINGVLHR